MAVNRQPSAISGNSRQPSAVSKEGFGSSKTSSLAESRLLIAESHLADSRKPI